jgi:hypothetical protein
VQTSQLDVAIPDVRKRENTSIRLYHLQADETPRYRAYRVQIPVRKPMCCVWFVCRFLVNAANGWAGHAELRSGVMLLINCNAGCGAMARSRFGDSQLP